MRSCYKSYVSARAPCHSAFAPNCSEEERQAIEAINKRMRNARESEVSYMSK